MVYKVVITPEAMGVIVQGCLTTPHRKEWSARTWVVKECTDMLTTFTVIRVRPEQVGTELEVQHTVGLTDSEDSSFTIASDNHKIFYLHSHHELTLDFSGVDRNTLKGISEQQGEYLSIVIFNDFRNMVARYREKGGEIIDVPVSMLPIEDLDEQYKGCTEFLFKNPSNTFLRNLSNKFLPNDFSYRI